ncbi:MAG: helix-turn-helix transcriptional regulator [Pyrobaculum arsenaticum]|uniref:helix-turn-helix transcriptional regulator n=1 Tax=Pyrobaculum arsenaticum TaxID=121277 RepID=UPI002274A125|nr:helix-turn-helix transcriptional regulator [Pyrobaculum arsenaticum]
MNITVFIILAPLASWVLPVYLPPNVTATVHADLPLGLCNATGVFEIQKPVAIACANTGLSPIQLSGRVSVVYNMPPPPQAPPPETPLLALATGVAAAAGLSHAASNRRELLAAPILPIIARIKRATAEDPVRREILRVVDTMGAATMSQIAKALGKSWGSVQWHVYVLEREGKLKSVKIGAFTYYFVNPKKAAEVILASVDPAALTPEDREKLDIMAAAA